MYESRPVCGHIINKDDFFLAAVEHFGSGSWLTSRGLSLTSGTLKIIITVKKVFI